MTNRNAVRLLSEPAGRTYSRFESNYTHGPDLSLWELGWWRDREPQAVFNVRINALTGEVWGMSQFDGITWYETFSGPPRYTRAQAAGIAAGFLRGVQPARLAQTRLQAEDPRGPGGFISLQRRPPEVYVLSFVRHVQGALYRPHYLMAEVNGDTGEVLGFSVSWDDTAVLPDPSGALSPEAARKAFAREVRLEPVYVRDGGPWTGRTHPVRLVYQPADGRSPCLDAFSGELLAADLLPPHLREPHQEPGMGPAHLEPLAPDKADAAENLLGLEKAAALARRAGDVPARLELDGARLMRDLHGSA